MSEQGQSAKPPEQQRSSRVLVLIILAVILGLIALVFFLHPRGPNSGGGQNKQSMILQPQARAQTS